jgi:HEAT repeat protein
VLEGRVTALLLAGLCLALAGCGARSCRSAGDSRLDRLVLQLEGGCCEFHTDPTHEQPDSSCKVHTASTSFAARFFESRSCQMWAAECIGEMGFAARAATPALIAAVRHGPNNYDTGDGIIPIRDRIVRALGQTGDERALEPLLEALENPRPVDAGPGAVGYASKEPVGEVAALGALGLLGPAAAPAIGRILPFLSRPIAHPRDEWIVRSAATALGQIQDPAAIPALMEALSDPKRAPHAARALGEFGPAAGEAAPALIEFIEESPDAKGNAIIRRAIRQISGKEAMLALPKSYDGMTTELMRKITRLAKREDVKLRRMHIDGPNDELAPELISGETVHVEFNRRIWIESRRVTGRVRVEKDGGDLSVEDYDGIQELERILIRVLNNSRSNTTQKKGASL